MDDHDYYSTGLTIEERRRMAEALARLDAVANEESQVERGERSAKRSKPRKERKLRKRKRAVKMVAAKSQETAVAVLERDPVTVAEVTLSAAEWLTLIRPLPSILSPLAMRSRQVIRDRCKSTCGAVMLRGSVQGFASLIAALHATRAGLEPPGFDAACKVAGELQERLLRHQF